ncbi:MAG: DUF1552 domain-containing protein [Nannocystaceae bacterium]|nr:DUF1552 domain-containing protein [bacterium]
MHIKSFSKPLSRRHVLRGLSSSAIALPLLEVMGCSDADPREDVGAAPRSGGTIKRFIGSIIPNGVVPDAWFPTQSGGGLQWGSSMQPMPEHGLAGLSDFADDLIVLRGIENVVGQRNLGAGHIAGIQSMLTGHELVTPTDNTSDWVMTGPSIDQIIAEHWESQLGAPLAKRTLNITARGNMISFNAEGAPAAKKKNVENLFDEVFGLAALPAEERARIRAERKSVLDGVMSSYSALEARVSGADKARVQAHLDAIRELELRIDTELECTIPQAEAYVQPQGGGEWENLPAWIDMMQDLLVLAFSCDVTRSATVQLRDCGGGQSYLPWLGWGAYEEDGSNYDLHEHHEMSHRWRNDEDAVRLALAAQYYSAQNATLLDKMRATPEGGGTLYDSVLLLQGSDIAVGSHEQVDMPFVVVGPAGGAVRGNRMIELGDQTPHNRLLAAVLRALGMADITHVGASDVDYGATISLA